MSVLDAPLQCRTKPPESESNVTVFLLFSSVPRSQRGTERRSLPVVDAPLQRRRQSHRRQTELVLRRHVLQPHRRERGRSLVAGGPAANVHHQICQNHESRRLLCRETGWSRDTNRRLAGEQREQQPQVLTRISGKYSIQHILSNYY